MTGLWVARTMAGSRLLGEDALLNSLRKDGKAL